MLMIENILGSICLSGISALLILTVIAELIARPQRRASRQARESSLLALAETAEKSEVLASEVNVAEDMNVPALEVSSRTTVNVGGVVA